MKKIILIGTMAAFIAGCAKKNTPSASAPSSIGSSGTVIAGSNTSAPASATAAPAATLPAENTGSKTPASPSTTASPEVQGQTTYNGKCGKCHGLKVVGDYTADRWASIMAVMAPKARLTDVEKDNVMAYVKANAKK